MLDVERLPTLISQWRSRQSERDTRIDIIDAAVAGKFEVYDDDEEEIENRSPNIIQVALEDTAEASALVPTVRGRAMAATEPGRKTATAMERIARSYMDAANVDLLLVRLAMDQLAYGLHVVTVTPDMEQRIPLIERRDPRTFYPDTDYRPGASLRRGAFLRQVYYGQLPDAWKMKLSEKLIGSGHEYGTGWDENLTITLAEYYDDQEMVVAGVVAAHSLYPGAWKMGRQDVTDYPCEFERIEHGLGIVPVVVGSRITLDGQFRGQFDQVVGMLYSHIRLMGLVLDYADQAVYSDVWVRDLIGEMPFGGGSYIQLGPQGAIGRVPPAVSSFQVNQDLAQLIENMHVAARYPKTRPGQIDQSIASAKFVEATVGTMNTVIRQLHLTFQKTLEKSVRIGFLIDRAHFKGPKTVHGVLRNQEFVQEYDPSEIDLDTAVVKIEYGLGLGRDPAQSAVLHIQYGQNEYISKEFVQEHIDGLSDVGLEQARIDVEKFESMILAKLLQGVEAGAIPNRALVEITKSRASGKTLVDLFEKYVVSPEEEVQENQIDTGMGMMMPGDPLGGMPPPGPGGPGAGPAGPMVPPAPEGNELLARINQHAPDGSMLGTQTRG